ncbi:hypothetical protein OIU76_005717 [Salix suchowensis]|nr:hypothetical protein OIU76_005717 [Salix suchowensis]
MINSEESKSVPSDFELGFGGRAFAAAGAAVLPAVIVNPVDVARMFADVRSSLAAPGPQQLCASECNLEHWMPFIK